MKKVNKKRQSLIIFQKKNSKGQFYLIAAIIIAGIVIGIAYLVNYSNRITFYDGEDMVNELRIEGEHVLDYEMANPTALNEFDDFSMQYSYYAKDKDIYFIIVDVDKGIQEAYKFTENNKISFGSALELGDNEIYFTFNKNRYTYKLEQGKNFYYLIAYDKGGEQYVYTG